MMRYKSTFYLLIYGSNAVEDIRPSVHYLPVSLSVWYCVASELCGCYGLMERPQHQPHSYRPYGCQRHKFLNNIDRMWR